MYPSQFFRVQQCLFDWSLQWFCFEGKSGAVWFRLSLRTISETFILRLSLRKASICNYSALKHFSPLLCCQFLGKEVSCFLLSFSFPESQSGTMPEFPATNWPEVSPAEGWTELCTKDRSDFQSRWQCPRCNFSRRYVCKRRVGREHNML